MNKIVIDGVDLSDLKARMDMLEAERKVLRDSIKQGASKFMAENLEAAKVEVAKLRDATTKEEAVEAAEAAYALLADVKFVSEVSEITYSLPFPNSEYAYGGYSSDEIITNIFDDDDNGVLDYDWRDKEDPLSKLLSLAEDMEGTVQEWNSSFC